MEPKSGKRAAPRSAYTQAVTFEFSQMDADRTRPVQADGRAVDISLTGMGLTTDKTLAEGTILRVSLPLDSAVDVRMPVFSEVVWIRPENGQYRAGLRFLA